jgi:anti-anti-sigma factor
MISIDEKRWCGASVLRIHGPLRVPVGRELRRSVNTLLRRGGQQILLDLSHVPAMDASGLGELVHLYNMATAGRGVLRVVEATARVRQLLDRAGLVDLLTGDARQWPITAQPNDRVA